MFARTARSLRVAAAPRPTLAIRFSTPISIRSLTIESTPSTTTESPALASQPSANQSSEPSAFSQLSTDALSSRPPQDLPYFVGRNRMNNMAVYERRYRGGNLKKTLLKKGEGNLQALRLDVAEALGVTEKDVKLNSITNHIEIKVSASETVEARVLDAD
ncbi:hypothetical protein PFICI_08290 [Pestalotiopsis fici W106-1]|uniref:Large ribosomal subunit protein mL49 n=1 Tax=Pestalotiopsis fici (strain W106-1 / CGMCC3.15140) TaxID=1229662 RepID=W3X6H3_PESFW|nr:uncharacterized protein PFICI_08290 [Pestalotiopsis fici W106-1]ETS80761.1 hypothetical protein PFICI_08290 [Pestalotiopsis fici W106-1]